jgi:phospholipid transport system substrate-binding protein
MKIRQIMAVALFSGASLVFAADMAPDVMVKNTADEVLTIIRSDKDIQSGNTKKVVELAEAKVLPHFDFGRMTRLAMGRNWNKATDAQKEALVKEFRTLLVRTYSVSLAQYKNQTLETKPLAAGAGDSEVTVKTLVLQPGGQPIPIDYRMAKTQEGWKVFDIAVEGVSLVTNYRGEFNAQVEKGGVEGLLKTLVERNSQSGSK